MLLFNNFTILGFVFTLSAILIGFTVHEFTHAYVANKLGDDTSKLMGRLSLNPFAHLDLFGTLFLIIAGFGWGKPVMVNSRNFKNPIADNVIVSLSGPMSNLALAGIAGLFLRFIPSMPELLQTFLVLLVFFNLVLMIFNFLPIPPLDGSKLLSLFLPEEAYAFLEQFGIYILLGLIIFSSTFPVIPFVISNVVGFFFQLITGQQIAI